jgi:diguanylate cyclase (GGDEF)-like protein
MDRLGRLLVLRSTIESERIPSSTMSSAEAFTVPVEMVSIFLGFDPQLETVKARTAVDQLMVNEKSDLSTIREDLLRARTAVDTKKPRSVVFENFGRVADELTSLAEAELGMLKQSMYGFEGDRLVTRSSLALLGAHDALDQFGQGTLDLFNLMQATGEGREERRKLAVDEFAVQSALRVVDLNAGPTTYLASKRLQSDLSVTQAMSDVREKLQKPPVNIGLNLMATASLFSGRLNAGRLYSDLLRTSADEARAIAQDAQTAAGDKVKTTGLAIALLSVASLGMALAIARRISNPLKSLARKADRIGQGTLDEQSLPERGAREVVTVTRAVNELEKIIRTLDRQTSALASGNLSSTELNDPLPGRLGQSVEATMERLSVSIRYREDLQNRLQHQADHDALTALPNRKAVIEALTGALSRSRRRGEPVAVLFIDLDGFKRANDVHGHLFGDAVLQECAKRLRDSMRAGDLVGRLGGDEFVMVCEGLKGAEEALHMAERSIALLSNPIETHNRLCLIGASVGVAMDLDGHASASDLLRDADLAMYRAKSLGRGRAELFDEAARTEITKRAAIEEAIPQAIGQGEFFLEYQPVVHVEEDGSNRLVSAEALLRWQRPGYGLVSPSDFIPSLESSPRIADVGRWVLGAGLSQLRTFQSHSELGELSVAVNIAARHLMTPGIVGDVRSAIESAGIPAHFVTVEITETSLLDDTAVAFAHMSELRELGVKIAIDDFGTGFTSINQLGILPIDILKIDASFVRGLSDPKLRSIVAMMIGVGETLGLTVLAEGVETVEEANTLVEMGCRNHQGFLYSRSLAPEAFLQRFSSFARA